MFWHILGSLTLLKLLFIPFYVSVDFEVHRNWMAITHSLPVSEWYEDGTSSWTIDYPPLFALVEWLFSQVAYFFDPEMVNINNLMYTSASALVFQRITVIVSDLTMGFGIYICSNVGGSKSDDIRAKLALLVLTNGGMLMVDHVHFHYTGFTMGILMCSVGYMLRKEYMKSAALYILLINLGQIHLYFSLVYFVYLLATCCNPSLNGRVGALKNLFQLSAIVIGGMTICFGPFVFYGQIMKILSRIFPLGRGLVSQIYWAPNFWALYNGIDTLSILFERALDVNRVLTVFVPEAAGSDRMIIEVFDVNKTCNLPPCRSFTERYLEHDHCGSADRFNTRPTEAKVNFK